MKKKFEVFTIRTGQLLREALIALDKGGLEIVLVLGEQDKLSGILTDGDIRRALLAGARLDDPVDHHVQDNFISVQDGSGRLEVLDLMKARRIGQVPVLDDQGRLVGLHTIHGILGAEEHPNWVVIMAGGRGERLRPLTDSIPKPMIRVAGRPILERTILHLLGEGFRKIFLSVNYLSGIIEDHFGDGSSLGCAIHYLRESEPLGTGGALSLLPERPRHPVLVLNGDLLTQFQAGGMLTFHEEGKFRATIGCYEYAHTVPYGVLDLDADRVAGMREKPRQAWTVNAGIYIFDPPLLERIPRNTPYALPSLVEECLDRGESVGAYRIEEDWIDIGQPRELMRACGKSENP